MIDIDFLKQLNRFEIVTKKKILTKHFGKKSSKYTGFGLIFQDYKQYAAGDDFRTIDWNVYARTEDLFVRRFEEERNLEVHIILDASSSMDFGSRINKYEYGAMLGLGFAYMAMRQNERFEFSTFSDKLMTIKAKKGKNQLISILEILQNKKPEGSSKLSESLFTYKKAITSKSLVVIISDFLYDIEELKSVLELFKKTELIAIQVLDKEEVNMPAEGDVVLEDSETKGLLRTYISQRQLQSMRKKMEEHTMKINELCDRINAKFISITTDTPIFDVFFRILK